MSTGSPDVGRRTILTTLAGTAAGLALARGANAQTSAADAANIAVVNNFIAAISRRDMNGALQYLAADCVYRMTETTPPVTGHDAIRMRLGPYLERSDRVEWEVLDTYARGPMVINHRIDRFISTTRPLTWEGVGDFFVKDGVIKEWFDYTIRVAR